MLKQNFQKIYGYICQRRSCNRIGFALVVAFVMAATVGIAFWSGFLLGSGNRATVNERQAVDEVRHLMPPELNGLSVGVMFDSISSRRYWWTHITIEDRFLLPNKETTWVHFFRETVKGYMHASINLDRNRGMVIYHMFVGGHPVRLNDLYEMFRGNERQ